MTSAADLLAKLRAADPGYKREALFEQIEKDHGRGFMKSLREQLAAAEQDTTEARRPQAKRRR